MQFFMHVLDIWGVCHEQTWVTLYPVQGYFSYFPLFKLCCLLSDINMRFPGFVGFTSF